MRTSSCPLRRHLRYNLLHGTLAALFVVGCVPRPSAPPSRPSAAAEAAADPLTAEMRAQAKLFVATVQLRRQLESLDYRAESLRAVDKWISANYRGRSQRFVDMPSRSAMAYVGEVIRLEMDGRWVADEPTELEARWGANIGRVAIADRVVDPTEWVYDAILENRPLFPRWGELSTR